MKKVTFEKYHCMGNDYLVYDPNKNEMELNEENIRLICDRNFGVGSDGILAGPYLDQEKMYVKILNPDGSEVPKSRKRYPYLCKISEGCRVCTEDQCFLDDDKRRGECLLPQ